MLTRFDEAEAEAVMSERLYDGAAVMLATGPALAASRAQSRRMLDGYAAARASSAHLAAATADLADARSARAAADARLAASRARLAAVRARAARP